MTDAIDRVMRRLGEIDTRSVEMIHNEAACLLQKGWSEDDTVRYLLCIEDVSPDLPEDVAIARMRKIRAKYEVKP